MRTMTTVEHAWAGERLWNPFPGSIFNGSPKTWDFDERFLQTFQLARSLADGVMCVCRIKSCGIPYLFKVQLSTATSLSSCTLGEVEKLVPLQRSFTRKLARDFFAISPDSDKNEVIRKALAWCEQNS